MPGHAKKVALAASTPTAFAVLGVGGKVEMLAEGIWSAVSVDGFPVQLESMSNTFVALCISASTPGAAVTNVCIDDGHWSI